MVSGARRAGTQVLHSHGRLRGSPDSGSDTNDNAPFSLAQSARGLGNQSPDLRDPDYLTPKARRRQRDISEMVETLVRNISGPGVALEFHRSLGTPIGRGYGTYFDDTTRVQGRFHRDDRLIALSFEALDIAGTALHEAYHDAC